MIWLEAPIRKRVCQAKMNPEFWGLKVRVFGETGFHLWHYEVAPEAVIQKGPVVH